MTAIMTAKHRAGGAIGVLCNGNVWAKFIVQTVVFTLGALVWLSASEWAFRIHLSY